MDDPSRAAGFEGFKSLRLMPAKEWRRRCITGTTRKYMSKIKIYGLIRITFRFFQIFSDHSKSTGKGSTMENSVLVLHVCT
jgi:hypothetical protein